MNLYDFLRKLEGVIPKELTFPWEFQGLEVGPLEGSIQREVDVKKVVLSLDMGRGVLSSIKRNGAEMVLLNNPIVEKPTILFDESLMRKLSFLLKERVSVYVAQSSLIMMDGGFNDQIGKALGMERNGTLSLEFDGIEFPISRTFSQDGGFMVRDFAREVASKLGLRYVKVFGEPESHVRRVAVFAGELKEPEWVEVFEGEVDLLITAIPPYEVGRYLSKVGMNVVAVDCMELKEFGMKGVKNVIQSEFPNVVFIYERSERYYSEIFF